MSLLAVKVFRDSREVCQGNAAGRREYKRRTLAMSARQDNLCAFCGTWMRDPSFDHADGRGHGGGFRDDRIEIDGEWSNAAMHISCNGLKASRRYHWQSGKYIPVLATPEDAERAETKA